VLPHDPVPLLARSTPPDRILQNIMEVRLARQKGVVDTLYQVETSHIPSRQSAHGLSGPEVWQQLTTGVRSGGQLDELGSAGPAEKEDYRR